MGTLGARHKDRVGILCAGGSGRRLWPLTVAVNKHLLPVYNKPLLHYSLFVLMLAGIRDLVVVTTPQSVRSMLLALGDGSQFGVRIRIVAQPSTDGIVGCLRVCEPLADGAPICLILGDNFFFGSHLADFLDRAGAAQKATIFSTQVLDARAFAVVERDSHGQIVNLVEKPERPSSQEVVTGLYFLPADCFARSQILSPSTRGELEITDLCRAYLSDDLLDVQPLPRGTMWLDCGTHDDLLRASNIVHDIEALNATRVNSLEELAFRRHWIGESGLASLAEIIPDGLLVEYLKGIRREESTGFDDETAAQ